MRYPEDPFQEVKLAEAADIAGCCRAGVSALLVIALLSALPALADEQQDRTMRKIASESGCLFCHKEEPDKAGANVLLPVAPSWKDIARRYRGQPGTEDRLTKVVISGSGQGASTRHWAYKVRDTNMPSNYVEISPDDARNLVRWILTLK